MLRILGSSKRLCDGVSRRDFLQAGSLGLLGMAAAGRWALCRRSPPQPSPLAARLAGPSGACFSIFTARPASWRPSTPSPTPHWKCAASWAPSPPACPGVQIGELLPETAKVIDRATIVRSMTHRYPLHASAFTMTSIPTIDVPLQMSPRDPRHWPYHRLGRRLPGRSERRAARPDCAQYRPALAAELTAPLCRGRQRGSVWRLAGPGLRSAVDRLSRAGHPDLDLYVWQSDDPLPGSLWAAGARLPLWPVEPTRNWARDLTLDRLNRRRSLLAAVGRRSPAGSRRARPRDRSTIFASRLFRT